MEAEESLQTKDHHYSRPNKYRQLATSESEKRRSKDYNKLDKIENHGKPYKDKVTKITIGLKNNNTNQTLTEPNYELRVSRQYSFQSYTNKETKYTN